MEWQISEGRLVKTFTTGNFAEAVEKLSALVAVCDAMDHHPDVTIHDYKKVTFSLITHSKGKITDLDYQLAKKIDENFAKKCVQ